MTATKAVIFDMDGVISETQSLHAKAEQVALKTVGINLSPEEISERFSGIYDKTWFAQLFTEEGVEADVEKAIAEKWHVMEQQIDEHGVRAVPGVLDLITPLHASKYRLGVGSASPRHFISHVMQKLALESFMASVHSAEEVARGKPEPDLFLLIANELGADPVRCVVIEDGRSGMIAARKASMKCIGLVPDTSGDYPADVLVTSLTTVTPDTIVNLLGASFPDS